MWSFKSKSIINSYSKLYDSHIWHNSICISLSNIEREYNVFNYNIVFSKMHFVYNFKQIVFFYYILSWIFEHYRKLVLHLEVHRNFDTYEKMLSACAIPREKSAGWSYTCATLYVPARILSSAHGESVLETRATSANGRLSLSQGNASCGFFGNASWNIHLVRARIWSLLAPHMVSGSANKLENWWFLKSSRGKTR